MSIFRNDTLGSWTRGGQAIVHNVRMTTQVFFQTLLAGIALWLIGTVWWALEHTSDYQRFVLAKLIEATFKTDAAPGTNDPVQFRTPGGKAYWTSADWLMASPLAKQSLHAFERALIEGALFAGIFAAAALGVAWFTFTKTGRGLGSNEYLRGARFGTIRQIRALLRKQPRGSFSIGGVPVPGAFEPEHILLCGAPGTGKTNLIVKMLDGIRSAGNRAIVYDTAGTFVEKFYRPGRDVILNPLDKRTSRWSPWGDVPRDYHYDQIAESTIPDKGADPFWAKAARGTLVAVLRKLAREREMLVSILLDRLLRSRMKDLAAFAAGTDAAAFISVEGERTSAGIQAELASVMRSFSYLDDTRKGVDPRMGRERGGRQLAFHHRQGGPTAVIAAPHHGVARHRDIRHHEPRTGPRATPLLRYRRAPQSTKTTFPVRLSGACPEVRRLRNSGFSILPAAGGNVRHPGCGGDHGILLYLGRAARQRYPDR